MQQALLASHGPGVVDARDSDGVTPLQIASELGNTKATLSRSVLSSNSHRSLAVLLPSRL
jgi:ankyrin repeat protein